MYDPDTLFARASSMEWCCSAAGAGADLRIFKKFQRACDQDLQTQIKIM